VKPDPRPFELGPLGGAGPAVLLLHGLTGTPWEMRPLAHALAEAGFACRAPLLPGHGTAPRELARVRREAWLTATAQAFDELAASHRCVYAIGLSLGGLLALRLCVERPVAAAVVLATPLRFRARIRAAVHLLAPIGASLAKTPGIADAEARRVHPGYSRMPFSSIRELLRLQGEVEVALPRVEAPLRLIYSRADRTVAVEDAERILSRVGSRERSVHYLERSDHVLPVDLESARVSRLALEFLAAIEGGARSRASH
jgi:carboxylesterase